MANKMMITGKVVKKPEHIELGKYNIWTIVNKVDK